MPHLHLVPRTTPTVNRERVGLGSVDVIAGDCDLECSTYGPHPVRGQLAEALDECCDRDAFDRVEVHC